jgi:hypothetical protein
LYKHKRAKTTINPISNPIKKSQKVLPSTQYLISIQKISKHNHFLISIQSPIFSPIKKSQKVFPSTQYLISIQKILKHNHFLISIQKSQKVFPGTQYLIPKKFFKTQLFLNFNSNCLVTRKQ